MLSFLSFLIFFLIFYISNITIATLGVGFYYFFLLIFFKIKNKKFNIMFLIYSFLFIFFGLIALFFNNDIFIKWKPTIMYWGFSLFCILSFFSRFSFFLKYLISYNIKLKYEAIIFLHASLFSYFFVMGFLNLYVAYNYSTYFWLLFKILCSSFLTFIFFFFQILFISKYIKFIKKEN